MVFHLKYPFMTLLVFCFVCLFTFYHFIITFFVFCLLFLFFVLLLIILFLYNTLCWLFHNITINLQVLWMFFFLLMTKPIIHAFHAKFSMRFEKLGDTKGGIRISKSKKNRQHNGQKKKDKQRSTKHTHKTNDPVTRIIIRTGVELRCSGRVSSSCSTSGTRRVNLVINPVTRHE
jgi:FlaA1/EpsC-like NDP-sugar epimerase